MEKIGAKKIAKYALLPGVLPRAKNLFASGFAYTAFLMANIYNMVRLLPHGHAYLNPQNIGSFGFRHVIAEAANNIVFSRKNIDQIIIFVALLTGAIIMTLQIILLCYSLVIAPAFAQGGPALGTPISPITVASSPSSSTQFVGYFTTPNPIDDIALNMLDRVFGIPKIFCEQIPGAGEVCTHYQQGKTAFGIDVPNFSFPNNFHSALHGMFEFYSRGLLFIALLIFVYFIVVLVGETAVTGTPFGERFKNIWVPIRIIFALGLLLPMGHGINGGQYITLYAAKMGTGFATNGWNIYNKAIADSTNNTVKMRIGTETVEWSDNNPIPDTPVLVLPPHPDMAGVLHNMSLAHACAYTTWHKAYKATAPETPGASENIELRSTGAGASGSGMQYVTNPYKKIRPYIIKRRADNSGETHHDIHVGVTSSGTAGAGGITYTEAAEFMNNSDIVIRFGVHDAEKFPNEPGNVEPTCGEIRITLSDTRHIGCGTGDVLNPNLCTTAIGGADRMQSYYYDLVKHLWPDEDGAFVQFIPTSGTNSYADPAGALKLIAPYSQRLAAVIINDDLTTNPNDPTVTQTLQCAIGCTPAALPSGTFSLPACTTPPSLTKAPCEDTLPSIIERQKLVNLANSNIGLEVIQSWITRQNSLTETTLDDRLLRYGWGGAGIWYNKIQELNGSFISSVAQVPKMTKAPAIMEETLNKRSAVDVEVDGIDKYKPHFSDPSQGVRGWHYSHAGNPIEVSQVMGSVFEFWHQENKNLEKNDNSGSFFKDFTEFMFGVGGLGAMRGNNAALHPMAQLTALGKGLVDSAVIGVVGGIFSGFTEDPKKTTIMGRVLTFFSSIAFIGLTAGVILFYILPILPFVYFFFAVGSWIKAIFEAMVGVPLWAIAHLRIDGDGLPGSSASNGYFMIFDIFLRPIATVFGIVASMTIFTAQVRILNFIWDMVIDNLAGTPDTRKAEVSFDALGIDQIQLSTDGVDQFFFTIIYALVVYSVATSSFKLIDEIPNKIMRWMGAGVSAFGDINKDTTGELTRYAGMGGITIGQQVTSAAGQTAGRLGQAFGNESGKLKELAQNFTRGTGPQK